MAAEMEETVEQYPRTVEEAAEQVGILEPAGQGGWEMGLCSVTLLLGLAVEAVEAVEAFASTPALVDSVTMAVEVVEA